jgi:hypothetical protein
MKVDLTDYQINLILYCLEQQASEFTWDENLDYKGILRAVESAANFEYDFGY